MADNGEIWRYLSSSDYTLPSDGSIETVRGLRRLWKRLRAAVSSEKPKEEPVYERAIEEDLARVLPPLDTATLTEALANSLDGWADSGHATPRTRVVVGPPGSRTGRVVTAYAERRQWKTLRPPRRVDLVDDPEVVEKSLAALDAEPGSPVVLPDLERWLLRSEHGLPPLRRLLAVLRERRAPLLVGCESWAWTFLEHTVGIGDLVGSPLALGAMDAPRLARWLGEPLRAVGRVCRSTEKPDESVFACLEDGGNSEEGSENGISPLLVRLARASRGNPGVALELWRRSLRVAQRQVKEGEEDNEGQGRNLWIAPLRDSEVIVSPHLEAAHKFVLYTILVHGGLEEALLHETLPFSRHDLLRWAIDLIDEKLLAEAGDRLVVPLAAYGAVRDDLESEGFLVDSF